MRDKRVGPSAFHGNVRICMERVATRLLSIRLSFTSNNCYVYPGYGAKHVLFCPGITGYSGISYSIAVFHGGDSGRLASGRVARLIAAKGAKLVGNFGDGGNGIFSTSLTFSGRFGIAFVFPRGGNGPGGWGRGHCVYREGFRCE